MENLTTLVKKELVLPERECAEIYSPKLGGYVPLKVEPKGKIQKDNVGIGPGSWY